MPAAGFHFQRLLRIIFRRGQHKRAGVDRNFLPVSTKELVERQAGRLAGDVPEADVKGPVGINRNVIPPAIIGAKLMPEFLANAEAAIAPAISAPRPAKPKEWPSMPVSVFIEMTRKSKFDLPPARISLSDMASRVLRQARTSMDLMINLESSGQCTFQLSKRRDCNECAHGCQRNAALDRRTSSGPDKSYKDK